MMVHNPTALKTHPASLSAEVLRTLFTHVDADQFLEVRAIDMKGRVIYRRFHLLDELQVGDFEATIPKNLNRKANLFFGILPRAVPSGGDANVGDFDRLWCDYDRSEHRPEWPLEPSAEWETSPGKHQAVWLLTRPLSVDERRVLMRRLVIATNSDLAAVNPERLLRIPETSNLKYVGRPRGRVIRITGRRYGPEEFDTLLPPLPKSEKAIGHDAGTKQLAGSFDPHRGGEDLPRVLIEQIASDLKRRGAQPLYDGRLLMKCPFPEHGTQHHLNFYYSPISGRWWCFGERHPGRRDDKTCVTGGALRLWAALYPGRRAPEYESPEYSPSNPRGANAGDSGTAPYDPPTGGLRAEAHRAAPKHKRTAELLRSVGKREKAEHEDRCGTPVKGKCEEHGYVREKRATGKTHYCSGCNTETSSRYARTIFPDGDYTILRTVKRLPLGKWDAAEVTPDEWEINAMDGERISQLIENEYRGATGHFRRVQQRYKYELLGWHVSTAVDDEQMVSFELQVLIRHGENHERLLQEVTGFTRKEPLWRPDYAIRTDYPAKQLEQLRGDWSGLLKTALLRLDKGETDVLFIPVYMALNGLTLSQAYGDLRAAYSKHLEEQRNGQADDEKTCPVVVDEKVSDESIGVSKSHKICAKKLTWILDPHDAIPVDPGGVPQGSLRR